MLGRKAPADVVLSHVSVGRHHAVLRFGPQACTVEDAQSTSGTWLNDRALRAPAALQPGDELRLGQVRLIVAAADPTPGP